LAGALGWDIQMKKDKQQFANLVQHQLLGYGKQQDKYAKPSQRIWEAGGKPSGKFRKSLLKYAKELMRDS